ncbi:MAG: DUF1353 domain-containing protein [Cyanobacteria bacterium P01_H01_bin.74]
MTFSTPEKFVQPVLQYDSKTKRYTLMVPYTFEWIHRNRLTRLICPAGFNYDKASVPRLLWSLARPDGPWEAASLFHDRFYQFKGNLPVGDCQVYHDGDWENMTAPWTRKHVDQLFLEMGKLAGINRWIALKYYLAVRCWPLNWFNGF